jgi:cytochrome c553
MSPKTYALTWLLVMLIGATLMGVARSFSGDISRGRYLAEDVAGCGDCHTPRDARGSPIKDRALGGAAVGFAPLGPVPEWAAWAPPLAGLPAGFNEEQLSEFLQTGVRPNGRPARPPMPQFRLERDDAKAVAAYLRSLSP